MISKYKTDCGGDAVKCDDIKLFSSSSTWNTKLSQIAKKENNVLIMTHALNDFEYIQQIFDKRPRKIFIICNTDSLNMAKEIKKEYPEIRIKHNERMNAKVVLIEPRITMFSSADFGRTGAGIKGPIELGVGLHSEEIYTIMRETFSYYWNDSIEI